MRHRAAAMGVILVLLVGITGIPGHPADAQSTSVQVYFSPEDRPSRTLISVFDHAQRQILFAIYDLTSRPIADALIQAERRHVDVWGIMDAGESRSRGNLYPELQSALGNHLVLRSGTGRYGIMHDKYAVVDGAIVVAGSYNWSYSADHSNHENLLILTSPDLARRFAQNFRAIWSSQ